MSARKQLSVIYDGQCSFCIRTLSVVRALDSRRALSFYDAHSEETAKLFPQLRRAELTEAMYTVAEGEPPHRGFYAFRRLLWSGPLMWPLLALFYFPGSSFFGTRIYAWVARNRWRLGCRSKFCALPQAAGSLPENLK